VIRQTTTAAPRREKYATNAGLVHSANRSSSDRVGSGTIPKIAMRTAPPAIKNVPRTIHGEKTSPRMKRAKKAFQRRETAPSGARITTGRDAIWTRAPTIFEDMNMAGRGQSKRRRNKSTRSSPTKT
jgi:hypothetical protein